MAIEKRRVRMVSSVLSGFDHDGNPAVHLVEAVDYVPVDLVDAYMEDARKRWQVVEVGDMHDPGPSGDEGDTHYPSHLDHPKAGRTFNQHGEEVRS